MDVYVRICVCTCVRLHERPSTGDTTAGSPQGSPPLPQPRPLRVPRLGGGATAAEGAGPIPEGAELPCRAYYKGEGGRRRASRGLRGDDEGGSGGGEDVAAALAASRLRHGGNGRGGRARAAPSFPPPPPPSPSGAAHHFPPGARPLSLRGGGAAVRGWQRTERGGGVASPFRGPARVNGPCGVVGVPHVRSPHRQPPACCWGAGR